MGLPLASRMATAQAPITTGEHSLLERAVQPHREKILLVPLDDRPATTQFAQMIGAIANVQVDTPPADMLGRFVVPGQPDEILRWMATQDLGAYQSVIVNTEMIAYGGLIASRTDSTAYDAAIVRLRRLWGLRKANPGTKFYAFTSIQRIAPTALSTNANWRTALSDLVILKSSIGGKPTPKQVDRARALRDRIPSGAVEQYYATRDRNHRVQQELLRMVAAKAFDYMVLGQDDAQPVGPHSGESRRLQSLADRLKVNDKVYFCEGIDQHSNVLVCRSLLAEHGWSPRVRVVFADSIGKNKIAPYESDHVENSLLDQLEASGARAARGDESAEFSLYVNTPDPRPDHFEQFLNQMIDEIDQGFPVAVADINLGYTGTGDPRLFDALQQTGRWMKLLAYAGWNTAGNTMGTTIPAATVYLLARRFDADPLARELSQRAFLLHRMVNDFEYHRFVRPEAYALQRQMGVEKEETYGTAFDALNSFVRRDMTQRVMSAFNSQFLGKRFFADTKEYEIGGIRGLSVDLPWPRAYEVRIGFQLVAHEASER